MTASGRGREAPPPTPPWSPPAPSSRGVPATAPLNTLLPTLSPEEVHRNIVRCYKLRCRVDRKLLYWLGIKKRAPAEFTFVAGCANGYIYYAPTAEQRSNTGCAQEDCDCLVAPEWQKIFEDRVEAILKKL